MQKRGTKDRVAWDTDGPKFVKIQRYYCTHHSCAVTPFSADLKAVLLNHPELQLSIALYQGGNSRCLLHGSLIPRWLSSAHQFSARFRSMAADLQQTWTANWKRRLAEHMVR